MKNWIIGVLIFAVVMLAITLVVGIFTHPPIPILNEYALRYNASPSAVQKILGSPIEVKIDDGISNKAYYLFELPVLEHPAQVQCFFVENRTLSQIHIQWELDSQEQAQQLTEAITDILQATYQTQKHYFIEENPVGVYDCYITMGTYNGATGLIYYIKQVGKSVYVTGIYHY